MQRCTKPDKREFLKISQAVGVGFIISMFVLKKGAWTLANANDAVGAIGYVVKLIHIPVNSVLVS